MTLRFENLSILLIEDVDPMRQLLVSIFESMNIGQVYTASNGESGYEKFRKTNADIVITDWFMDPIDGVELTKIIRKDSFSPNRLVPIIMMSGYSDQIRIESARDVGVTEFLVKPFSADDLAKRVSYVINRPRDFIDMKTYFGPCRRRLKSSHYIGPLRREADSKT